MAIRIDYLANTKDFLKGTSDVEGGLGKVAGSLDGLASDSKSTSTKMGEDFKGSAKTIERSFQEMAAEAKDQTASVTRAVRSGEQQQTQAVGLSAREQKKLRREALKQVADQAKITAAQSASSIDGTAAGLTNAVTGASIGVLASLPPQFAAAGAAGIAALGLIAGQLTRNDESTQEFKQHVADLAGELIKAGSEGTLPLSHMVEALQKLATETAVDKANLSELFHIAKEAGSSFKDLAQAYAGNEAGLKKLVAEGKAKEKQDSKNADALAGLTVEQQKATAGSATAYADAVRKYTAQKKYNDYLEQAASAAAQAKERQDEYIKAGGPELERKAALIAQVNTAYDDAAGAVTDYIDAESGVLDTDRYIAAMTAKQKALADYQKDLVSSGLTPEARDFLNSQGADAAAALLAGYVHGTAAQKAALEAIWDEAGKSSSGAYSSSLEKNLPSTVNGPKVVLDTASADAQIAGIGKGKSVVLKVALQDRYGKPLQ